MNAEDLQEHRDVMIRFAMVHLRNAAAAEDAVQDTFVAALQSLDQFRGQASVRTWLIGILKRKLIDRFRAGQRELSHADAGIPDEGLDDTGYLTRLFDRSGHWATGPRPWGDPHESLENDGFWRAFETCVANLPPRAARVFVMRELIGLEPAEVCKESGISASNYWVTMHRARLRLRECLENHWFDPGGKDGRT